MFKVLLFLCVLLCVVYSESPRTLVLVDDDLAKNIYSRFLRSIQNRGHKLEIKKASDSTLSLFTFGARNYENILILSPSTLSESGEIKLVHLLEFVDNGGNVLVTLEGQNSELVRKFGDRCGIVIHPDKSHVRDHQSYDNEKDPINHEVIVTDRWCDYQGIISDKTKPSAPVLFDGIGMSFKSNAHLNTKILSGSPTAYSDKLADGPPEKNIVESGNPLILVGALQTRNHARVSFVGSRKFFSDDFWTSGVSTVVNGQAKKYKKSGNEELGSAISAWTFGERGILRAVNVTHKKVGDTTIKPNRYRIKDIVLYSLDIQEYRLDCNCWIPFESNDIQFEFIRLDPFVRKFIKHEGKGHYSLQFELPDVFGVYKFEVNYLRHGWSHLFVQDLVTVRPFRHDEYDRFIFSAFPYYLSAFSMMAGFVVFTVVILLGSHGGEKIW